MRKSLKKLRAAVLTVLGGRCTVCGIEDRRMLQLDHINNTGAADRRIMGGNQQVYRWIRNNPEEAMKHYQLLCANHNAVKEYERRRAALK